MKKLVVLQWYYDERRRCCCGQDEPITPELTGVFGPFTNPDVVKKWIGNAFVWASGGSGFYEYSVQELQEVVP